MCIILAEVNCLSGKWSWIFTVTMFATPKTLRVRIGSENCGKACMRKWVSDSGCRYIIHFHLTAIWRCLIRAWPVLKVFTEIMIIYTYSSFPTSKPEKSPIPRSQNRNHCRRWPHLFQRPLRSLLRVPFLIMIMCSYSSFPIGKPEETPIPGAKTVQAATPRWRSSLRTTFSHSHRLPLHHDRDPISKAPFLSSIIPLGPWS